MDIWFIVKVSCLVGTIISGLTTIRFQYMLLKKDEEGLNKIDKNIKRLSSKRKESEDN